MKTRYAHLCQVMALALLVCLGLSALAAAQDTSQDTMRAVPRFTTIPAKPALPGHPEPSGTLQGGTVRSPTTAPNTTT
jgi:hypothetical protein